MKQKPLAIFLLLATAALLGMVLVIYATSLGPGVGGDATIYLTSARNFAAGKGLGWMEADGAFRLLPYTPPFYPLILSGVGLLAGDFVAGARWFNVLVFGLTILVVGWFFYRLTGRAWLAALLGGVLAASPVLVGVQVWAMSEPVFLLMGFAGLLLLLEYLDTPRGVTLFGAAILCGLAFLTRYIGIAFVATGALALILLGKGPDRRIRLNLGWAALREALLFGVIAVAPILVWLAVDFSLTGTVGSRSGQPVEAYLRRFVEMGPALEKIYLFWLLPDSVIARLPGAVRVALWLAPLAGLAALAAVLFRRLRANLPAAGPGDTPGRAAAVRLAALSGLFIFVYLVALAFVQVLTYPPITLASRMLSPVHLAALVLVFALLHLGLDLLPPTRNTARLVTGLVFLGCAGIFGMYLLRGALVARDYHRNGIGYMSPAWQNSPTLEMLRKLDPGIPVISNETTAIMFFLDRPAYAIQEIYQDQPQEEFTAYGAGDDAAQRAFRSQGGALVLFRSTLRDDFAMYGDRAEERIQALTRGLIPYYEGEDGAIYFFPTTSYAPEDDCG